MSPSAKPGAVAFDLDGTLVDMRIDIEGARAEIAAMFAALGYHQPMRPILDAINRAAATVAKKDEEIYPLILRARRILDAAELEAAKHAVPIPGAAKALESLRDYGFRLGIVTNNSKVCVQPALASLGVEIDKLAVATRDDVKRPKPAPDGVIRVAAMIGTKGENLWVVGDSPVDVSAAVAANPQVTATVRALAIPRHRSTAEQLRAAGPCTVCDSVEKAVAEILANS